MNARIDLVKAFIQLESGIDLHHTTFNYDNNGGVRFSGYGKDGQVAFALDKYQVEAVSGCKTIDDVFECYKEMEFFQTT